MADVIAKQIESVVGIKYLNINGAMSENGLIREIIDPTETKRLEIVKLFNETRKSPSPTEGIEIWVSLVIGMNNRTDDLL